MIDSYTGKELGCYICKHFDPSTRRTCTAFPNGIPLPIQNGEIAHVDDYPGDNGIHFEMNDDYFSEQPTEP
mgnify:CR=1 FL=1